VKRSIDDEEHLMNVRQWVVESDFTSLLSQLVGANMEAVSSVIADLGHEDHGATQKLTAAMQDGMGELVEAMVRRLAAGLTAEEVTNSLAYLRHPLTKSLQAKLVRENSAFAKMGEEWMKEVFARTFPDHDHEEK
jgi:hypothetical protein